MIEIRVSERALVSDGSRERERERKKLRANQWLAAELAARGAQWAPPEHSNCWPAELELGSHASLIEIWLHARKKSARKYERAAQVCAK